MGLKLRFEYCTNDEYSIVNGRSLKMTEYETHSCLSNSHEGYLRKVLFVGTRQLDLKQLPASAAQLLLALSSVLSLESAIIQGSLLSVPKISNFCLIIQTYIKPSKRI